MMASNFASPLMNFDAVDREVNSIESEYQMCFNDDNVRAMQCLAAHTVHKDHLLNRFAWGSNSSLKGKKKETLIDDLRKYNRE